MALLRQIPGCSIAVARNGSDGVVYTVQARYYEGLKDMLDKGVTGWIELDSTFGDGKVMIRLEKITDMSLDTPSYCEAADNWYRDAELTHD